MLIRLNKIEEIKDHFSIFRYGFVKNRKWNE